MSRRVISDPRTGRKMPIRQFLRDRYGVPVTHPNLPNYRPPRSGRAKGLTSPPPHRSLNPSLRKNIHRAPPPLSASDLSQGLHSLLERGLIPPHLDLTSAIATYPSPITTAPVPLNDRYWTGRAGGRNRNRSDRFLRTVGEVGVRQGLCNVKYDFVSGAMAEEQMIEFRRRKQLLERKRRRERERDREIGQRQRQQRGTRRGKGVTIVNFGGGFERRRRRDDVDDDVDNGEDDDDDSISESDSVVADRRKYEEMMDAYSMHHLMIRRGRLLADTEEFLSFQRAYVHVWGPIVTVLKELERLLHLFDVPLAYIDGKRVAEVADIALEQPTEENLLSCIVNYDEVLKQLRTRRRRGTTGTGGGGGAGSSDPRSFDGPDGKSRAAIMIQKTWRMYQAKKVFAMLWQRDRSARKILQQWFLRKKFFETREKVAEIVAQKEIEWEGRMDDFRRDWNSMVRETSEQRRLIIHLPSIAGPREQRQSIPKYRCCLNSQFARLLDLVDERCDVLYISPSREPEDVIDYILNIITLGGGAPKGTGDAAGAGTGAGAGHPTSRGRLTMLVPDHVNDFPEYTSLTRALLYSPRTMKFISTKCLGRNAWIVPGRVGEEELRVASKLGLPLLGPHPKRTAIFSLNKSAAKKIFEISNVFVPPGTSSHQGSGSSAENDLKLILSKLIIEHPETHRWIIKLNHEFDARGIAYLDVSSIRALAEPARNQVLRDEESFSPDREALLAKLRDEVYFELRKSLEHRLVYASKFAYPTWRQFLAAADTHGYLVEACADDIIGSFTVNLFIHPTGDVEIHSIQERVTHLYFFTACYAFPQKSLADEAFLQPSLAVARTLHHRGTMGYVTLEYVAFEESPGRPRIWGIDIRQSLTDSALYHRVFEHVTSTVPEDEQEDLRYLYTGLIRHPSFSRWRHSAFFHELRQAGLLFDLENWKGIVFHLVDDVMKGILGCLCIGKSKLDVVRFLHGFATFVQEKNDENVFDDGLEVTAESDLGRVVGGLRMLLSISMSSKV